MTVVKTHSLPGFANVELGDELKLTNLTGLFKVVKFVEDGNSSLRRISDRTGELESGTPFRANLNDLNVDYVI